VLGWLQQFPDITAAQVTDWLKEHYSDQAFRERTIRRQVSRIRNEHHITKQINNRQYQAVPELPMGKQMQVDFGEKSVRKANGSHVKLYALGAVLSNSRYKYGEWTDRPLSTTTLIQMLRRCFEYIGGVPEEIVIDQDKLMTVSENHGDIVYTYEFEKFKEAMGFKVWLCRKSDPESKGKIEAVVKYMKFNFGSNRLFVDLNIWNQDFRDWLERTGNCNLHGVTKKVPAEVFVVEKQYLRPVPFTYKEPSAIVTRDVRKDNTIWYCGNRYTVPVGTYQPGRELEVREEDGKLVISEITTGEIVATHKVSLGKGTLIRNNNHLRDNNSKINELYEKALGLLGGTPEAIDFLNIIHREKGRYVRDQFNLMIQVAQKYPLSTVEEAISYCLERKIYSAVDCREVVKYLLTKQEQPEEGVSIINQPETWPLHLKVKAEHRSISVYSNLLGGAD
jgi:transposase